MLGGLQRIRQRQLRKDRRERAAHRARDDGPEDDRGGDLSYDRRGRRREHRRDQLRVVPASHSGAEEELVSVE